MKRESISAPEARRIALSAQGFGLRANAEPTLRSMRALVQRLGTIQIDSVNVLVRSHYLPFFSRLGAYDRRMLERLAYGRPRRLFEYWAHEASLLPMETYPLLRWRMRRALEGHGVWQNVAKVGRERRELVDHIRKTIEAQGPMSASEFEGEKRSGSWWGWNDTKRAVEHLFWTGELAVQNRRPSFERVYDLAQRVIPAGIYGLPEPPLEEAQRALMAIAANAFGVATERDLRDYFRLAPTESKERVAELMEAGELQPIRVEGWKEPAYLAKGATTPRRVECSALLSPFDSLVWNRARMLRLFDFQYRIEIYTPAHKRVHGYYVLPYLLGEQLVARVDLKADRKPGVLRVLGLHLEPKVERRSVMPSLREDLQRLCTWLGLERVAFKRG